PAVILVLAVSVCTILIVFVLPNFVSIFAEFNAQLPLPTKILLAVGRFAQIWRIQIVAGLFAVTVGVLLAFNSSPGRVFWHHAILEQIADFLAEEMDYKVRNMIALMEPTLVIAVGGAVGFVAVSVILPMYGLLKAVH